MYLYFLLLFCLLQLEQIKASTCHILCNCQGTSCLTCYEGFDDASNEIASEGGTCNCPSGLYTSSNTCLSCSNGCKTCQSSNLCIECYETFSKVNGACSPIAYNPNDPQSNYLLTKSFKVHPNGTTSVFGLKFTRPSNEYSTYSISCPNFGSENILAIESTGTNNLGIIVPFLGLPYHHWVRATLQVFILDECEGKSLKVKNEDGVMLIDKSYTNSKRNVNLCGASDADSLDQITFNFSHEKNSLVLEIQIEADMKIAIKSILIQVGTCPKNCSSCSFFNKCLACKESIYSLENGVCKCNPSLSYETSFGCIGKCMDNEFYSEKHEICRKCLAVIDNCKICSNESSCEFCEVGSFKHQGHCVKMCPTGTFGTSIQHLNVNYYICNECDANCTECKENQCIICSKGFFLVNGNCEEICNWTVRRDECIEKIECNNGCSACTSFSQCTSCVPGRWLVDGECRTYCETSFYRGVSSCLACASNCEVCFSAEICQNCISGFILRKGECVASFSCLTGSYLDEKLSECFPCPSQCLTCYKQLCYSCNINWRIENGKCVQTCSEDRYKVSGTGYDKFCYRKDPLCEQYNTYTPGQCDTCRSLQFPLSLSSSFQCSPKCSSGTTYNPFVLTEIINNDRKCTINCTSNCEVCTNSSYCIKCKTGFLLSGTTPHSLCISSCESGFFSDSFQCIPCPHKCTSCDMIGQCFSPSESISTICDTNCQLCNSITCIQCKENYFLNISSYYSTSGTSDSGCNSVCPPSTFADSISRQCRRCKPECTKCSQISVCEACAEKFYLQNQACVQICDNGKYAHAEFGMCLNCSGKCRDCFGGENYNCLTCYLGYVLENSECVKSCPMNQYVDASGHCDWCHFSCKYCSGPSNFQCNECENGNYLYQGECFSTECPRSTYLAKINTRECEKCSDNCATCTEEFTCEVCDEGFILIDGKCLTECPLSKYLEVSIGKCSDCPNKCEVCELTCQKCISGYILHQNTCILECPKSTFPQLVSKKYCRKCPSTCTSCTSLENCTDCSANLALVNGECKIECEPRRYYDSSASNALSRCRLCTNNCERCTRWGCDRCVSDYYSYEGNCVMSCPTGYYNDIGLFSCGQCPSTCFNCTSYYECKFCLKGYILKNGTCSNQSICQNNSNNCEFCANETVCIKCKETYKIYVNGLSLCYKDCPSGSYTYSSNECKKCSPSCKTCSSRSSCLTCQASLIYFYGNCISSCDPGFFIDSASSEKICKECSSICKTCLNETFCISCSSTNYYLEDGICKDKSLCSEKHFYSEITNYCEPCIEHCKVCISDAECQACESSFYLTQNNTCALKCQFGTYLKIGERLECKGCPFPCTSCASETRCSSCMQGYPLDPISFTCASKCSLIGYFSNSKNNICEKCEDQCLKCFNNSKTCEECSEGYFKIDNECVVNCPLGTFNWESSRSCLSCSTECRRCTGKNECIECNEYWVLFEGVCQQNCPQGLYSANRICHICIEPCRECSSSSAYECLSCQATYYFYKNRCVLTCPDGYFAEIVSGSCRKCPSICKTCSSYSICSSCSDGSAVNSNSKQCGVIENCNENLSNCSNCLTSSVCTNCYAGFYLLNNECNELCPTHFFSNINTGTCEECADNCDTCANKINCLTCSSGYYVLQGLCYSKSSCPFGTFAKDDFDESANVTNYICESEYCMYYESSGECNSCTFPKKLSDGVCVSDCPIGKYTGSLSCLPCSQGCLVCSSLNECKRCLFPDFSLMEGQCQEICNTGYYPKKNDYNDSSSTYSEFSCESCSPLCLSCSSANQCNICQKGTSLSLDGKCSFSCLKGEFSDFSSGKCMKCEKNCEECNSKSNCVSCGNSTYLLVGQCLEQCPRGYFPNLNRCMSCKSNCQKCDFDGNCLECGNGYRLNEVEFVCEIECSGRTYLSENQNCVACSSNCLICFGFSQCLSCNSTYKLFNGRCLKNCPIGFFYDNQKCTQCNTLCMECVGKNDNCTLCKNGFVLKEGFCISSCQNNTFLNETYQCESCNSTGINSKCSVCYGNLASQCIECNEPYVLLNGICNSECPPKYYSSAGLCLPCNNLCATCDQEFECKTCLWGSFFINNTCIPKCPNGTYSDPLSNYQNCKECSQSCQECISEEICVICKVNYFLSQGKCVLNCSSLSLARYPNLNSLTCDLCPSNCISCSNNICQKCKSFFYLYGSFCVSQCPSNTYLSSRSCFECNILNCQICESSTKCISCIPNKGNLHNGQCLPNCPLGYYSVNSICTLKIKNETSCTNGLYLLKLNDKGTCVEYCPEPFYAVNSNNSCTSCSSACSSCSSITKCESCYSPYFLLNGVCVPFCPVGYIQVDSVCSVCLLSCATCEPNKIECESCKSGYNLLNGKCFSTCPSTYYPSNNKCLKCGLKCKTCTTSTNCLTCSNPKYSSPNCNNNCGVDEFRSENTTSCEKCVSPCKTCRSGSIYDCLECAPPFVLIDSQCRNSTCPSGYVNINNFCTPCADNCQKCSETLICEACFESFVMNNGECISDCSVFSSNTRGTSSDENNCIRCQEGCLSCIVYDPESNGTLCVGCATGYIERLGECISSCPIGEYKIGNECQHCPANCISCTALENSCSGCNNSNFLFQGQCIMSCPANTFKNNSTKECEPCNDINCLNCSTGISLCTKCESPSQLSSNNDCTQCISSFYFNGISCVACSENCKGCSITAINCSSCSVGKVLFNGCRANCPPGYYQYLPLDSLFGNYECELCESDCLICQPSLVDNSSICTHCKVGYKLNMADRSCVTLCPISTYTSFSLTCFPCDNNCETCSILVCHKCLSGFKLYKNLCYDLCPSNTLIANLNNVDVCRECMIGCLKCISDNECDLCRSDYYLAADKTCHEVTLCEMGKYSDNNGICQICKEFCLQCTSFLSCIRCDSTKFLSEGDCLDSCLSNQYNISIKIANKNSNICYNCTPPCLECVNSTNCTNCFEFYFVTINNTCISECGDGFYEGEAGNTTNGSCIACGFQCKQCNAYGCFVCNNGFYLNGFIALNSSNGSCIKSCSASYYKDDAYPPSCKRCSDTRCADCNITNCTKCTENYTLYSNSCLEECPERMMNATIDKVNKCVSCPSSCRMCKTELWCEKCETGSYLFIHSILFSKSNDFKSLNSTCMEECPPTFYEFVDITSNHNHTCEKCKSFCKNCTNNSDCSECLPDKYVLENNTCIPIRCLNCTTCENENCVKCQSELGFYLYPSNSSCLQICPNGTYPDNDTKTCENCMDFCELCPNRTYCSQCKKDFNFSDTVCVAEDYLRFGSLSNMSELTKNITMVTSKALMGISVPVILLGEMMMTYFVIEFTQLIRVHLIDSGNPELETFLDSLLPLSLEEKYSEPDTIRSRLLYSQPFLEVNKFVFILLGGFVLVFVLVKLLKHLTKNKEHKVKEYIFEICEYMEERFVFTYIDFFVWVSYLPFTYFSLYQLRYNFSFSSGMEGFSTFLSMVILPAYSLYPFFIYYTLFKNYSQLNGQTRQSVETQLNPYIYKIKKLQPEPSEFKFCSFNSFWLMHFPLKYLLKLIFIFLLVLCENKSAGMISILAINAAYIAFYLIAFRPRETPYLILDVVVQLILLAFEIVLVIYFKSGSNKTSLPTIFTHLIGFISINLFMILGIVFLLMALIKLICCCKDVYEKITPNVGGGNSEIELVRLNKEQNETGEQMNQENEENVQEVTENIDEPQLVENEQPNQNNENRADQSNQEKRSSTNNEEVLMNAEDKKKEETIEVKTWKKYLACVFGGS